LSRAVVDASVAAKWFRDERLSDRAQRLLTDHRTGAIQIWIPSHFILEMINAAARRWRWTHDALQLMVSEIEMMALTTAAPDPSKVAA
jgi:predicted nucleic acid-binding protein